MKRKTIVALIFVFAAVAAFLPPTLGTLAQAQQACSEFRAIAHGTLPTTHPLSQTDTWGADVWGTLGGDFLSGYFTGNDGTISQHGVALLSTNGSYTFVFGTDSFTIEVAHAVAPLPPGEAGLGDYRGTATIVQGTGRFAYASGNIQTSGPFIVWFDQSGVHGRGNFEIRGNICGVD